MPQTAAKAKVRAPLGLRDTRRTRHLTHPVPAPSALAQASAPKIKAAPKQAAADATLYGAYTRHGRTTRARGCISGRAPQPSTRTAPFAAGAIMGQSDLATRADAFIAKWAEAGTTQARQLARVEVLSLLLRLAGAGEDFCADLNAESDFGNEAELKEVTDSLANVSSVSEKQYVLLQPSFDGKAANERVRARFSELVHHLVERTAADKLVGEEGLAEYVIDTALPLAACGYQPLRHASSLACTSLFTALLKRGAAVAAERASILKQVEGQAAVAANLKKKAGQGDSAVAAKASKDAEAQLARLTEQAAAAASTASQLVQCAGELVNTHIPQRYRDVAPAVRNDTIVALGAIIVAHPETYLTNGYLKYLGWMLNDAEAGVRGAALVALRSVYTLPSAVVSKSSEFMTRFKGRVAEMTRDVDDGVAADAVRLLHVALAAEQLTNDEMDVVRETLVEAGPAVRAAAAAMLLDFFPAFDETVDAVADAGEEEEDMGEGSKGGKKGKKDAAAAKSASAAADRTRRAVEQLTSIIEAAAWLLPASAGMDTADPSTSVTSSAELVASGFWSAPRGGVLTDWDAYRALLLPGDEPAQDLTELQTRIAIRLLFHSAMVVVEGVEPVHVRGSGGKVTLSSAPAHREAAATTMSASLTAMLPDLLGLYGSEAVHAVPLASLFCFIRPSVYGSASGARLATAALHQLTRLINVHTSETALEACVTAMGMMCASEQPRCKDARAAASKLVASTSASVARLLGKLTGEGGDEAAATAGRKSKGKGRASKGKGKAAPVEEDEEMDGGAAAEEAVAGSPAGLARYCAQQVRRLRVLADILAAGDTEITFPELSPTAGGNANALMSSLDGLLRDRRELAALFESTDSATADVGDAIDALSPVLTSEAMRLYTSIFSGTVARVYVRAASAAGGTDDEKAEVEDMAGRAVATRDALLEHVFAFLLLRHPVLLAEYCAQAGIAADSEEANSHSAISACYPLPPSLPTAERLFIMRSRQLAYFSLVRIAQLCATTSLPGTIASQLRWSASELESYIVSMYVNAELDVLSPDVVAEGLDMPGVAGGLEDDEEGAYEAMEELTAEMAERLKGAVSSKDLARATAATRTETAATLHAALENTRVEQSLHKLLDLAICDPSNDRIGSSIIRRLAEELNEAGPVGVQYSEVYSKRMIDVKRWADLLTSQLRSISDGVKYIVRMVRAGRELAASAGEDEDMGDEAREHNMTTSSAVEQLISISRKQVLALGKPATLEVLTIVVRTMFKFAQESLEYSDAWPWRTVLLAFVMPYLTVIPPKSQEALFKMFYDLMEDVSAPPLPPPHVRLCEAAPLTAPPSSPRSTSPPPSPQAGRRLSRRGTRRSCGGTASQRTRTPTRR